MSVNSKMTAIADEIRTLSDTNATMGLDDMATVLSTENANFNSNLTTQDALIAQIQSALQGKAAGGGVSVEAWTGTIKVYDYTTFNVYYIDQNLMPQTTSACTDVGDAGDATITIAKNTYVTMYQSGLGGGMSVRVFTGDNIEIADEKLDSCCILPISNNFTIIVTDSDY